MTASGGVHGLVTPAAVFVKRRERLALQSWHPALGPDEIRERTGFAFDSTGAGPTPLPTPREAAALRSLDEDGAFERDSAIRIR